MDRCPACKARLSGNIICHRCKANLGLLVYLRSQAKDHYQRALSAFENDDARGMLFHARRACLLHRTPESLGLLACATVMATDFELAVSLWKKLQQADSTTSGA